MPIVFWKNTVDITPQNHQTLRVSPINRIQTKSHQHLHLLRNHHHHLRHHLRVAPKKENLHKLKRNRYPRDTLPKIGLSRHPDHLSPSVSMTSRVAPVFLEPPPVTPQP